MVRAELTEHVASFSLMTFVDIEERVKKTLRRLRVDGFERGEEDGGPRATRIGSSRCLQKCLIVTTIVCADLNTSFIYLSSTLHRRGTGTYNDHGY